MRHLRFTLSNLLLWLTLGFGTFYIRNLAILTDNMTGGFDLATFWIFTIACFGCMVAYFFLEHKRNKTKIDKVLFPAIVVFTVIMAAIIWMQKGQTFDWENGKGANEVIFTFQEKLEYTIRLVFMMLCTYMCLYCVYIKRVSNRSMLWLSVAFLVYVFVTIIFSFIKESQSYMILSEERLEKPQSLFHNPNTYALTLFIGVLSCFVINYYKANVFTYLCIPFLAVIMLFTGCATSTILSMIVIPIYFVFDIARHAKTKPFKTIIITGICIFIFIIGFFMFFALGQTNNQIFAKINKSLSDLFKTFITDTYTGRTLNWAEMIKYSFDNIQHTLFGRGYLTSEKYVPALIAALHNRADGGSTYGENGFIYLLFSTGLMGLIAYLAMLGYFGYCCVRLLIEKKFYFVALFSLCVISMSAYNMMEANNFFDFDVKGTYITLAFFMPIVVAQKYLVHKKDVKETLSPDITKPTFNPAKVGQIISIICLSAIGVIAPVLLTTYSINNQAYFKMMILFMAAFAGIMVVFPYLVTLWIKNDSAIASVAHVVINLAAIGFAFYAVFMMVNMMVAIFVAIGIVVVDMVIYALIRKDFFKQYFSITFVDPLKIAIFPLIIAVFLSAMIGMVFQTLNPFSPLTCLALMVLTFSLFCIALFILPNKSRDKLFVYLNNNVLYNYKHYLERGLL